MKCKTILITRYHQSIMKRFVTIIAALLFVFIGINVSAQSKTKISDGVYLVRYGNSAVIEDDKNQRSISIEITQEIKDRQTNEKIYNVVCGKWTKRVVKDGLKAAITAGIAAAGTSIGTSAIVSAASTAALYIYEDACEYYGEKVR